MDEIFRKIGGRWVIDSVAKSYLQEEMGIVEVPVNPELKLLVRRAVAKAREEYARFNETANGDGPLVERRAFEED